MPEIYFCRHGITEDLEHGIRNRPDTVLTPTGEREAITAGEQLGRLAIRPDIIFCSSLLRAQQSARLIAKTIHYSPSDIKVTGLLDERGCGIAVGMKNAAIKDQYPDGFDTVPGAELTIDLQSRAAEAAALFEQCDGDVVLAVGHGVFGRAIARHYAGRPYTDEYDRAVRREYNLANGQIMRLLPTPVTLFPVD